MNPERPILIVEDESLIALNISAQMRGLGYHHTSHARDGAEAIQQARALNPELILMDINLQGEMDGIETARLIREQQDIPVIFLTALTDEQTIQRASKTEPYAYLVKPFRPHEIETAITITLNKHASEKQLKESEERYRRLFEEALDGIAIIASGSGILLDCNPALLHLLEAPRSSLIGQPLASLNAPGGQVEGGQPEEASIQRVQISRPGGGKRQIEIKTNPFTLHGQPVIQAIFHDITERQQVEDAERKARQQAEALRESMEALVSDLSLEEVLKKILAEFGHLLPHDAAAVILLQDGRLRLGSSQDIERPDVFMAGCLNPNNAVTKQIMAGPSPVILGCEELSRGGSCWEQMHASQNLVAIHLQVRGKVMGYLLVLNNETGRYEQSHLNLAQTFANQAAIAIENARLYEEERLAAMTDPLTGLYNRRFFYRSGANELERGQRYGQFPALIILDIDFFKRINDTYGHPVGDLALRFVSRLLRDNLRKIDAVVRLGGEEFAVLLPNTPLENACLVAERLRALIEAAHIPTEEGHTIRLTMSAGVATPNPAQPDLNQWIHCADQALYQAKDAGRNQVAAWTET